MTIRGRQKLLKYGLGALTLVVVASGLAYASHRSATATEITTEIIEGTGSGRIIKGESVAKIDTTLQTRTELVYESDKIPVNNNSSNAAVLSWQQSEGDEGVHVILRTFDGKEWSKWIKAESGNDRPDTAEQKHSAIILSANIHQVQYRFELAKEGAPSGLSPAVDLKTIEVESIDASKGPSIDKPTLWQRVTKGIDISNSVFARSGQPSPRIYSRAEWGSPEPESSTDWEPEYRRLGRSIVHHTATTASADSAAAVRAIWQYHRYSNGWGDIGYNYLVDQAGRIFQGRYFDHSYAENNDVDVVGGHAYGNNYGTTGISALGDFTNTNPSADSLHAIAFVASYKLGAYNIDAGNGSHMIGHRDVGQTACPGARLYTQLPTIRAISTSVFPTYQIKPYAWQYAGQYAYTDETKTTPVNLMNLSRRQRVYVGIRAKNVGSETWYNSGANPVRVGTSRPLERDSKLCDETWINCRRPTALLETEVAVGEIGTFEFWFTMPASGGGFNEHFNLLAEGSMWMTDQGLYFGTYAQPATYTYELTGMSAYSDNTKLEGANLAMLVPGQKSYVVVTARNTGNETWVNTGPNPVRIATSSPRERNSQFCDETWINCRRPATLNEASVVPGEEGTFEFWYKSPGSLGERREGFNILVEGIEWMNDTSLNLYSKVIHPYTVTPGGSRMITGQQLGPEQTIRSDDNRFMLILQGDGNLVLYGPTGPRWFSSTVGSGGDRLILQGDGNLVLYDNGYRAKFNTNTATGSRTFLNLQNDGNLVLYDEYVRPLWISTSIGR